MATKEGLPRQHSCAILPATLPEARARVLYAVQQPFHKALLTGSTKHATWCSKSSFHAVSTEERSIPTWSGSWRSAWARKRSRWQANGRLENAKARRRVDSGAIGQRHHRTRQASSYLSILRPRRRLASPSRKLRSPSPTQSNSIDHRASQRLSGSSNVWLGSTGHFAL
jgi:hypothetical protein